MALVQAAGGTLNGTTWLDRTNYYETLPATSWSWRCGSRRTGWARSSTR